jgi:hypothetical protein
VWVTDDSNNSLNEITQGSVQPAIPSSYLNVPTTVAINAQQNVWIANDGPGPGNYSNGDVKYVAGVTPPFVFYTADTPTQSYPANPAVSFVAIDGTGTAWNSLVGAACLSTTVCFGVAAVSAGGSELSGPGYTTDGYQGSDTLETASGTAIDSSGNVWVLNSSAQNVTELIGAAAPVLTPLALAVSNNSLGARP